MDIITIIVGVVLLIGVVSLSTYAIVMKKMNNNKKQKLSNEEKRKLLRRQSQLCNSLKNK